MSEKREMVKILFLKNIFADIETQDLKKTQNNTESPFKELVCKTQHNFSTIFF